MYIQRMYDVFEVVCTLLLVLQNFSSLSISYSSFGSKLINPNKEGLGFGRLQTIGAINPIFYLKRLCTSGMA